MFYDIVPSADSAAAGIVTLLAAAQALSNVSQLQDSSSLPIMYDFFNGVSSVLGHVAEQKMISRLGRAVNPILQAFFCNAAFWLLWPIV